MLQSTERDETTVSRGLLQGLRRADGKRFAKAKIFFGLIYIIGFLRAVYIALSRSRGAIFATIFYFARLASNISHRIWMDRRCVCIRRGEVINLAQRKKKKIKKGDICALRAARRL